MFVTPLRTMNQWRPHQYLYALVHYWVNTKCKTWKLLFAGIFFSVVFVVNDVRSLAPFSDLIRSARQIYAEQSGEGNDKMSMASSQCYYFSPNTDCNCLWISPFPGMQIQCLQGTCGSIKKCLNSISELSPYILIAHCRMVAFFLHTRNGAGLDHGLIL